MCAVLVYGDFGDTQHIGCFNPACDVLAIAKGLLHSILCIRASAERMNWTELPVRTVWQLNWTEISV